MQNGVVFNMDGPVMTGTWFSPHTGDSFTVRDAFFEDNIYKIMATDGRCFTLDMIERQGYIQSQDGKVPQMPPQPEAPQHINNATLLQGLDADDDPTLKEALGLGGQQQQQQQHKSLTDGLMPEPSDKTGNFYRNYTLTFNIPDAAIIERALGRHPMPIIEAKVTFAEFPEKEIEMLESIMNISADEIAAWYVSKMDGTKILDEVRADISSKLQLKDIEIVPETKFEAPMPAKKPQAKKTKKKK